MPFYDVHNSFDAGDHRTYGEVNSGEVKESHILNQVGGRKSTTWRILIRFGLLVFLLLGFWALDENSSLASSDTDTAKVKVAAPTRLVIPSISLDSAVKPMGWKSSSTGNVWKDVSYAVGWHVDSVMPGQSGNMVFSGHNNIKGRVFRNLKRVKVGDTLKVYVEGRAFEYEVTKRMILREAFQPQKKRIANARWIGSFPDERVTLVTCHPSWSNTHRLILVARPISK